MPVTDYRPPTTREIPVMPNDAGSSIRRGGANSVPSESLIDPGVFNAGFAYRIPSQSNMQTGDNNFKLFDTDESEIWSVDIETEWQALSTLEARDYWGFVGKSNGDLVVVVADDFPALTTVGFLTLDHATGATSVVNSESGGGNPVWPGLLLTDPDSLSIRDTQFNFDTTTHSDLSRTFVDIDDDDNFIVIGQSANNGANSVTTLTSAVVVVNSVTGAIESNNALTYGDNVTPVNHPIMYRTKDGKILLGQIFSRFDPFTGQFQGRFTTIIRGNTERIIELPNDSQDFFVLNRFDETPSINDVWMVDRGTPQAGGVTAAISNVTALLSAQENPNPWFHNGSLNVDGIFDSQQQGFVAWPEPLKFYVVGDHISINPMSLHNDSSNIGKAFIEGAQFMLRELVDLWLTQTADKLALDDPA